MENIASYYKSIDNGGISLDINKSGGGVQIVFSCQYFGYPSIHSFFDGGNFVGPQELRELGTAFLDAAAKLEQQSQE